MYTYYVGPWVCYHKTLCTHCVAEMQQEFITLIRVSSKWQTQFLVIIFLVHRRYFSLCPHGVRGTRQLATAYCSPNSLTSKDFYAGNTESMYEFCGDQKQTTEHMNSSSHFISKHLSKICIQDLYTHFVRQFLAKLINHTTVYHQVHMQIHHSIVNHWIST